MQSEASEAPVNWQHLTDKLPEKMNELSFDKNFIKVDENKAAE